MSAVVDPKCGHASHLMEINIIDGAPQVHLHFLTEDLEYSFIGFSKIELCCHGCGESVLIYYDKYAKDEADSKTSIEIRDSFTEKHKSCPNRDYEERCPNFRTKFDIIDLRAAAPKKRGSRGTRPSRKKGPGAPVREDAGARLSHRPLDGVGKLLGRAQAVKISEK